MKTRVITAVIALIVFIPLIIVGSWPLMLAAIVLGMVAMSELLLMKKMFLISFEAIVSYLGVAAMIVPQTWLDFLPEQIGRLTLVYVMVALLLLHTVIRKQRFNFDDAGVLTLGMLYIGMGFNAFTVARAVNFQTLLYGMLIVWLTDSGAYLFGRQFGKHKLAPNVSLAVYLTFFPVGYDNLAVMIVLTLLLSILGQFGDLVESALKRYYGVKDSGKILPGHGGILDRFDSMLLVLPAMALLGIL